VEVARASRRVLIVAASMFLLAALWQFLTYNGFPNDHYFHVARARQMLLGDWPIRDYVDPGAPLQAAISAVARGLFGDVAGPELLVVALGVAVGAAATAIGASWLSGSTIVGVGVTVLEILASPRSYSYPKMLLYGLAGCVIVALTAQASRARLLIAAGLTAVAFLMRHDHGLFIGVACAAAMLLSASRGPHTLREYQSQPASDRDSPAATTERPVVVHEGPTTSLADAARRLGLFAAAVAVLVMPWALWVQYHQGLIPYFEMGIAVSRREADISLLRDLPYPQLSAGLTTANMHAWLYYLFWTLPVVSVVLALLRRVLRRERWAGESLAVAAIALIAFALDATFLRNPLETRLADVTVPAALLGAWLLGLVWSMKWHRAIVVGARAAAAVVLLCTTVAIWRVGDVTGKLDEVGAFDDEVEHVQEHTAAVIAALTSPEMDTRKLPSRVSAGLVPFFRYLNRCTDETDRLLVSGPYPDVFVLARRGFAGGHIAFMEAFYHSDADQRLTLERMTRQSVPFVVLPLDDQDAFARSFPRVLAHVTAAYDVMTDIPVDGLKGVRIMIERARPRMGTDRVTGWPCFTRQDGDA
jgi:hypothetical protein